MGGFPVLEYEQDVEVGNFFKPLYSDGSFLNDTLQFRERKRQDVKPPPFFFL